MANETVTALSAATTLTDTDLIYVVAGGNSRKMTWAAFRAEFLSDSGVEANADVTDTANVTAAGALMDSEVDANIKTFVVPASTTISAFAKTLLDDANAGAARTTLGAEPADADILKADTADILTKGFGITPSDEGTKSSGTYTVDEADSNIQYIVNGGGFDIDPPVQNGTVIVHMTNNASAGTMTTGSFTLVDGDSLTTTNTHEFLLYIVKANDVSHLTVKALQ